MSFFLKDAYFRNSSEISKKSSIFSLRIFVLSFQYLLLKSKKLRVFHLINLLGQEWLQRCLLVIANVWQTASQEVTFDGLIQYFPLGDAPQSSLKASYWNQTSPKLLDSPYQKSPYLQLAKAFVSLRIFQPLKCNLCTSVCEPQNQCWDISKWKNIIYKSSSSRERDQKFVYVWNLIHEQFLQTRIPQDLQLCFHCIFPHPVLKTSNQVIFLSDTRY